VKYSDVGKEAIYAMLQSDGQSSQFGDLVGSACVINGVFPDCPPPIEILEIPQGGAITEVATFGPVRLKPDSRLEICATNALNADSVAISVSFYRARNSSEPFSTRSGVLEPGKGKCVSVSHNRVGDRPIFAVLTYEVEDVAGPAATLVSGAAIINGVFEHLPGERRFFAVL
jgi:hypothetical protein